MTLYGSPLLPEKEVRSCQIHQWSGRVDKPSLSKATDTGSLGSRAMEETKRLGSYMQEKAEQATRAVGAGMESLGGAIHEHEPEEGVLHKVGEAMAAKLEGGGRYLESRGLQGVGADLTGAIRRNPVPALLVGVGVGFLLAQMLKRS